MNYTPIPLYGDTHIPEYGLHGPMIDGLLAARHLLSTWVDEDKKSKIDAMIAQVKSHEAKLAREQTTKRVDKPTEPIL